MQTTLKILAYVVTVAGFVGSLNVIPGVDPLISAKILFGAVVLKDTVNRVGDFLDNGKEDGSFKA